jgi:hypothetical protein
MATKEILYFDRPGPENTDAVVKAVKKRAQNLQVKHLVVASVSGETMLSFWKAMQGMDLKLVSVTEHAGYQGGDDVRLSEEKRRELESKGIAVLRSSHALSGVGRSISQRFGGVSHVELIAYVLRQFGGDGLKVAVEVSIMAADAGLIPTDREVIAVGGTGTGVDTAIVLKAAHMNDFFDLEVREIIAKPRQRELAESDVPVL